MWVPGGERAISIRNAVTTDVILPHENAAIDTSEFPLGLYLSNHVIDELAVVTKSLGQCATIVRVCLDVDPHS